MPDGRPSPPVSESRKRLLEAAKMQEIEGNPLSEADMAMFDMFERENWPPERRRTYIMAMVHRSAAE